MVIVMDSVGIKVRELRDLLHSMDLYEAETLSSTLWQEFKLLPEASNFWKKKDERYHDHRFGVRKRSAMVDGPDENLPAIWAQAYTYDKKDHAPEIAKRHEALCDRLRNGECKVYPVGSDQWRTLRDRQASGEVIDPIIVAGEEASRGLDFDGVSTVYCIGLPRKPEIYMHLAGRVGRLGQKEGKPGKIVSVVSQNSAKVLKGWSSRLGPGFRLEDEPIQRIRSYAGRVPEGDSVVPEGDSVDSDESRPRRQSVLDEPDDIPLLPEPEDYVRVPGTDEDIANEYAFPEVNKMMEVARLSEQPEDHRVRRRMQRLMRSVRPT
jgi:hypothetical protein